MEEKSFFEKFYGVFAQAETWLNVAYLFLTFPLGIAYFVFLVTGWSLGISLVIIWIGLLVLALVFAISWGLTAFERWLSAGLLRVDIPPMGRPTDKSAKFWPRLKAWFGNPVTWKGMLYLLLKFPLGILNFTVATTVLSVSLALLATPLALIVPGWQITWDWNLTLLNGRMFIAQPDPYVVAGISFLVGVFLAPASLHLLNWMAGWQGKLAQKMLGRSELAEDEAAVVEASVDTEEAVASAEQVVEQVLETEAAES